MTRKSKKTDRKPAPELKTSFDDELVDEEEAGDDEAPPVDVPPPPATKLRDWRDVEKLKEERRLRQLIDDELDFEDPPRRRA